MKIELPTIQNWNCHSCAGCCTQHEVAITEQERQRIVDQGWTTADGIPEGLPVVKTKGPPWARQHLLNWKPDGSCIFLDDKGLCRIHAKFGEPAKPLACRVYPYAFHPAGNKVVVSVRFSCPSAVENKGRSLVDQRKDLEELGKEVVPEFAQNVPPPPVSRGETVEWRDFLRFVGNIEDDLADDSLPVSLRLVSVLSWLKDVERAKFGTLDGKSLEELLLLLRQAARSEIDEDLESFGRPTRMGRLMFRLLVANYARRDTQGVNTGGLRHRIWLFRAATRFSLGRGNVPPLQSVFTEVPFARIEEPFGGIPDEADEMLTRYLRVKVRGLQFCGRAFFGESLVDGFRALALVVPAVLWVARWLAAGEERDRLEANDVARAIAIADHFHAYSPASGSRAARSRVRILEQLDDIRRLVAWYSR